MRKEKLSEMTDSVGNSKVLVQESEIMESAPSPPSVHNIDSEGHTESLDEEEAINMYMDDDDIETIESMNPSDIVRVYDAVKRIKKLPQIPTKKQVQSV